MIPFLFFCVSTLSAVTFQLTIDDGPNANTISIAEQLVELKVPATWYVTGSLYPYKSSLQYLKDSGFSFGNHTRLHDMQVALKGDIDVTWSDMKYVEDYMASNFGVKMKHFRAPYGVYSNPQLVIAKELGYSIATWDVCMGKTEFGPFTESDVERSIVNGSRGLSRVVVLIHSTKYFKERVKMFVGVLRKHGEVVE